MSLREDAMREKINRLIIIANRAEDERDQALARVRELEAALRPLIEDFAWLLEQHQEHEGTYSDDRLRDARAALGETGCALDGCPGRGAGPCPNDYAETCEALFPEPSNMAADPLAAAGGAEGDTDG